MKPESTPNPTLCLTAPKRCSINLQVPVNGLPLVNSLELWAESGRHHVSFSGAHQLDQVFETGIAATLARQVAKLSADMQDLSLPDQVIEAKGLVLAGTRLVSNYAADGTAFVVVRFKQIIGDWRNGLIDADDFGIALPKARDVVAMSILADISMPLLDICDCVEAGAAPHAINDSSFFRHIGAHADKIRFEVELIKRYLASLDRPRVSEPTSDGTCSNLEMGHVVA
ncbi:hypothetical protein [uncultured Sulfitobacter sp.]|uniref:hypothetical protein n=1 Tax=uncultured Sulfitobacter sp. TaxID=191468 RepID=UPI00261AAADE|nr:hypothetical protein [uncultured Sulfitobacter sp.]